ncbi:MAG: 2-oxoacid:ferredoxin oxidoreductase subunit beta [Deltaproteobacteria bacterium]|nr:2-oxoacid:ferredoxin oxidoreductase subunit beta [Deltaproteobacteria bacterium]
MKDITKLIHQYLRHDKKFPHVWCPGCGNGIVLGALIRAIDHLEYSKDEIVLVSGIGCSGRMSVYVDFNTLHTTHGRALTFATGIKMAKPDLKVIVIMGDGDALAIGGNHFIHAARRNINLTALIINNSIFGMTGGQHSPATPYGKMATTTALYNIEPAFNIAELAVTAGAVFVARGTAYHADLLHKLIEKALHKNGFSLLEIITQCPTFYGRKNRMGTAVEMMEWQRDSAVPVEKWEGLSPEEREGKFSIGVLMDKEAPGFLEEYEKVKAQAKRIASLNATEKGDHGSQI